MSSAPQLRGDRSGLAPGLDSRLVRPNPQYRLVERSRVAMAERRRLGIEATGPGYAAVLLPRVDGLPVQAVSRSSLTLLRALRRPASRSGVARSVRATDGSALARLVLDAVLEVRCGHGFVTGAAAACALGFAPFEPRAPTRLARLSVEALRYAQAMRASAAVLAEVLYAYNRTPVSPLWAARLAGATDVARLLGLGRDRPCGRLLASHWRSTTPNGARFGWLGWYSRPGGTGCARHKIYVSIDTADLEAAFPVVVGIATDEDVPAFKVAADVYGLQRPDKLVLYVNSRRDIERLAGRLRRAMRGARAQGAPFSCALDDDGLLSWGIDPVAPGRSTGPPLSWRQWVCERLASALRSGQAVASDRLGMEPWQYALQRLRLDGVDTDDWTLSGGDGGRRSRARH